MHRTALVWDDDLARYRFVPGHPLNPRRLELTVALLRELGLVGGPDQPVLPPRAATDEELLLVHTPDFLDAVRRASRPGASREPGLARYGLGTGDVPIVEGMHAMGRGIVGSTLAAATAVMGGAVTRAWSIAGGLHHAMPRLASGFCVYNDVAVAIRWIRRTHGARVLYVDYDAHHADGVQRIFYDDPDVLTVSFHESGRYLYPGTGYIHELGEGDGYGYSVNVPLEPYTVDASVLAAFESIVPELAGAFRPDVLVLQTGCDAHAWDPLTHLQCTTGLFERLVGVVSAVADEHCGGRIVATGGGGYAIHTVVPRAWTLTWAALAGLDAGDTVPPAWLEDVAGEAASVPVSLRDPPGTVPDGPATAEAARENERTVRSLEKLVFQHLTR